MNPAGTQPIYRLTGIQNPGNFCYINASIQCIRHIRPIINLVNTSTELDDYISKIFELLNITSVIPPAMMKNKADIVKQLLDSKDEPTTKKVNDIIESNGSTHEEFLYLLDKISKESSKIFLYIGLRNLLCQLISGTSVSIDARQFYNLCAFATQDTGMSHIVDGRQNDAVEFLMCLLDYMHDSHSMPIKMDIQDSILSMEESALEREPLGIRIKYGLLRDIHSRYSKSYTSFNRELYFYNLNIVRCGKCAHISLNYSPYNILCLPLNEVLGQTIYDCMDKMFCREALDCGYKCEKCKNTEDNTIEKKILTRPQTLIICLKRFDFKVMPGGIGIPIKNSTQISYPMMLDISKYYPSVISQQVENTYKLIGVVNHVGRLNFGHYYSYCYNEINNSWHCYNDDRVSSIPEINVLNNDNAYILFYQAIKKEPTATGTQTTEPAATGTQSSESSSSSQVSSSSSQAT